MDATQTHRDLIERCRQGRRDAQFELYGLYSRAMYNTALRMVRHPHDAEDLLQSVFVEVCLAWSYPKHAPFAVFSPRATA